MRALSVEDKAEKKRAKKERQRSARAQAAAAEVPNPAIGSSAAQQLRSSVQRSSPPSLELPTAEQKPSSAAQAGAPTEQAVLQAAEHLPAEPQPASGEGRRQRKGQGKLNRSGTLPSGRVHSAPAEEATSPGVPGSNSTAESPAYQTSTAQATDEHVSAFSSPAEHPESSPSALHASSLAQRVQHPIHGVTFAARQPQSGGSSMTSPGQHADRGARASAPVPGPAEEESWQEVRSGRRKPAAKPAAARAGKGRRGNQAVPEAPQNSAAAAQMTPQQSQRLHGPPESAAGPELPKPGPTQADAVEAPPHWPALHSSPQRQPAQSPVHAAPAPMHRWPPLDTRPEPEDIPGVPELAPDKAPQRNMDHEALLTDLLQQPKARSSSNEQQSVRPLQKACPTVHHCTLQADASLQSAAETPAQSGSRFPACCPLMGTSSDLT